MPMFPPGPNEQIEHHQLHELLFLFAYGDARGSVSKPWHLGPGLVAAILIELAGIDALAWLGNRPRIQAVSPFLPPSRTAMLRTAAVQQVLAALGGSPRAETASHWMRALGAEVHEHTTAALSEAGTVRRGERKSLTGRKEVVVQHSSIPAHLQARVLLMAKRMREVDTRSAALCGLIVTLRLEGMIKTDSRLRLASELRDVSLQHAPHSQEILAELRGVLYPGHLRGGQIPLG